MSQGPATFITSRIDWLTKVSYRPDITKTLS